MNRKQFKQRFAKQLKEKRAFRNLTQDEVASATGLTAAWISHFECGRRLPDAFAFWHLEKTLGQFHLV